MIAAARKLIVTGGVALCTAGLYAFLGHWEGAAQYTVYPDRLAAGLPTVCRGLTRHVTDTPIIIGDVWSQEKCEQEELRAIERVQRELIRCFRRIPPQSVFEAASSHAWNFGSPATCGSAAMRSWNNGQWAQGCRQLQTNDSGQPAWSYVRNGFNPDGSIRYQYVQGLANRRAAEHQLCLSGLPGSGAYRPATVSLIEFTVE